MSNPNEISKNEIDLWCDDYLAICAKHGLYLVVDSECWLQYAGEPLDFEEAAENMRQELQTQR